MACEGFKVFTNFLAAVGNRPSPKHTLDRIDNDRGYSCGQCDDCHSRGETANCRWATMKEQSLNKRNNRLVTFNGETKPVAAWAEQYGLPYHVLHRRIHKGWPAQRALNEPVEPRRSRAKAT